MKEPWEFEEADLLTIIDEGQQESLTWEYKSCHELSRQDEKSQNELCKDVSAMANAAGGTIIYGIEEKDHKPVKLDGGFDVNHFRREWIEQILNHNINKPIEGLRLKAVPLPSQGHDKYALVICVPESLRAPHQARDKKFYRRRNFAAEPMEEYEIREAYLRMTAPLLKIRVLRAHVDPAATTPDEKSRTFRVSFCAENESDAPALYSLIDLRFPLDIQIRASEFKQSGEPFEMDIDGLRQVRRFTRNLIVPNHMPIWKGVAWNFCEEEIRLTWPDVHRDPIVVVWRASTPHAATVRGRILLMPHDGGIHAENLAPQTSLSTFMSTRPEVQA